MQRPAAAVSLSTKLWHLFVVRVTRTILGGTNMGYLTAEEIYHLVISTTPPADIGPKFNDDIRALKRLGHFSSGAQQLIHRMQTDSHFLSTLTSNPSSMVNHIGKFSFERFEILPLMFAALLIEGEIPYGSTTRPEFVVMPSREEAMRRFDGQIIDVNSVRQEVMKRVLDRFNLEDDIRKILQTPRVLLALEDLNLSEFVNL